MTKLELATAIAAMTVAFGMSPSYAAKKSVVGTPMEACKDRTNKLAVIYRLSQYPDALYKDPEQMRDPLKAAENVVGTAYGETKHSSDKAWPGLYDWSVSIVLKGFAERQSPAVFQLNAMSACLDKYQN